MRPATEHIVNYKVMLLMFCPSCVWRAFLICIFILFLRVRGPPLRGGVKGGVKKGGGRTPPQNGGRDSGFFWGSKNGQKWSKKVRDGGVSKSAFSGGRGGFSRKKNVGAWGAESLKILSPPPPGGCQIPPLGYDPPPSPAKNREIRRVGVGGAQKI